MSRRTAVLLSVLAALLALATLLSYRVMIRHRAAAMTASNDLAECYKMAPEIESYRKRPAMAADQERIANETTGLIEQAARSSGISTRGLVRITPAPAHRLADTVYKEKPTQILLKGVTLRQLVSTLHRLASSKQSLYPKSLRITAPRVDDIGRLWTAEIVVTYLIYEPLRPPGNGGLK